MSIVRLAMTTWVVCATFSARAGEPYREFLQALRENGYYDLQAEYLDQIAAKPNVPAEILEVIDYEKARALLDSSTTVSRPEEARQRVHSASQLFSEFLKSRPDHELAADASMQLAGIVVREGKMSLLEAATVDGKRDQERLRLDARKQFQKARNLYETARDQHKAAWDAFPRFVDAAKDPERHAASRKAKLNYVQTQLNLAILTYDEAQSYLPTDEEFPKILNRAVEGFEKLHTEFRTSIAGMHARVWQGKCFEELGRIREALGIYQEILSNPGSEPALINLKDTAEHFRLICLNHDSQGEYPQVIQESDLWIKERAGTSRGGGQRGSRDHQGIVWESIRAREGLAADTETSATLKKRLLLRAIEDALPQIATG